jgi:hypothetical protein
MGAGRCRVLAQGVEARDKNEEEEEERIYCFIIMSFVIATDRDQSRTSRNGG